MIDKYCDSFFAIDGEHFKCVINNKECNFNDCKICEIAKTYEASPNTNYKP